MSGTPASEPAAPGRTRFITHRGTTICFLDFSGITDPALALAAIREAQTIVTQQPPASVRTLTYVKDATFNRAVVAALKELARANKPHVRAGAIVGMGGIQRAVYIAVTQFTGRRLPTFSDLDQAKDWLASQ
jgi:hypothetical protein